MNKRYLDLVVVCASLPITLPIMGLAALALRLLQGKDIFFFQDRIGKDGKSFTLVKFRTMKSGSGCDMERTTAIGALLRKLSIDELPEIYNILKGEMSIVGPRPLPVSYLPYFSKAEDKRHQVLPGLTGLAQVSGRNRFSWAEKFKSDLEYIEKASVALDLKIIFKTFSAIFSFSKVNASVSKTMSALSDRLYIIGAGGHAKVAFETALQNGIEVAGILDANEDLWGKTFRLSHGENHRDIKIGRVDDLPQDALVFIAIGNNSAREKTVTQLQNKAPRFASLIHPEANVSESAIINEGTGVFMGASVQSSARIGSHAIINTNSSVDHDCEIESFAHIAPGASLCGGVKIGKATLVGVGSSIAPLCSIEAHSTIAAGSSVNSNLLIKGLYAGSPARLKKEYIMEERALKLVTQNSNIKSLNSANPRQVPMALPDITESEVQAAAEVVRSKRLAMGPKIKEFEKVFANYTGRKHAIAVSSGTAGLHLSLMALGITEGDEVLVPSYTFVASVNCILYVGATPVFVDIDEETFCICPKDAKNKITNRTKAMVSVDVFGHPAPLDELENLCQENNLYLIDDSCEALGASLKNKKVGKYGDVASFAFYPNKQITTGEGGMIVTDNDEVARNCRTMMNQGRDSMSQWLEHVQLGFNFRMSEVQAAIGVAQMARLDEILKKREIVATWYNELLADSKDIKTQVIKDGVEMSWFVFVVTLSEGLDRDLVIAELEKKGIPSRAYFTPIHTQPYLKKFEIKGVEQLPNTNKFGSLTMALPFYGDMPKEDVEYVCETLKEIVQQMSASEENQSPLAA